MNAPLRLWLTGAAMAVLAICTPAKAASLIRPTDWQAYKAKFVDTNGRIIDDGNGGISHSEGQGYGLLLAFLADSRADFEQIWSFTHTELLLRDDGLVAWKWDPAASPHVTDLNNAVDGDILIAYALAKAGTAWNRPDFTQAAATLAQAIGKTAIKTHEGKQLLMPGTSGFGAADRGDGPVVNLSYLVLEAFPELKRLAPDADWAKVEFRRQGADQAGALFRPQAAARLAVDACAAAAGGGLPTRIRLQRAADSALSGAGRRFRPGAPQGAQGRHGG